MENFSTTTTIPEPETFAFYWSFILYIIVVEKGREEEEGVGELVGWLVVRLGEGTSECVRLHSSSLSSHLASLPE